MGTNSTEIFNLASAGVRKLGSALGFGVKNPLGTTLLAGAGDQMLFDGAGLNALYSKAVEKGANALGIDPNIVKAALPTAIGGLLGGLVGQSGIGMALGTAMTALKAVNDPASPVRELAAGFIPQEQTL
jgi:hypothetical protein